MNTISSPVYGTRRAAAGIPSILFGKPSLYHSARRYHGALPRSHGREAASTRTRCEIGIGLSGWKFRDTPRDANLAIEFAPVKYQCCMRIRRQLPPLAALVIREEQKAALIHSLEQDHARRRAAAACGSRERHRVGLRQPGAFDSPEPAAELLNRIRVEGALSYARSLYQIPVYG